MTIKRCKVTTQMRCPFCDSEGHIWCGHKGRKNAYQCRRCQKFWEIGPEACKIRQLKLPNGLCTCVFNGTWLDEEIKVVETCAFRYSEKTNDEWGWYKGRHFYTAWKLGIRSVRVYTGRVLLTLVDKVAELCKPNQSL